MTLGEFCQVSLGDAQTSTVSGGSKDDGHVVSGYPWRPKEDGYPIPCEIVSFTIGQ